MILIFFTHEQATHEQALEKDELQFVKKLSFDHNVFNITSIVAFVAHPVLAQYAYRHAFKDCCFTRYPHEGDIFLNFMRAAISRIEKLRSHVALSIHCTAATSIKVHTAGNKLWYSGVFNNMVYNSSS